MMFNNDYYRLAYNNPTLLANQEIEFFGSNADLKTKIIKEYERTVRYINDVLSNEPFYTQNQLAVINDSVDSIRLNISKEDYFNAGDYIICLQNILKLQIKLTSILVSFILDNKSIEDYVDVAFFDGTCFITDDYDDDNIKQII